MSETPSKGQIDSALAKRWGATGRTIYNWRKAGAPLDDEKAMGAWLMSRGKVPGPTAKILEFEQVKGTSVPPPSAGRRVIPKTNGEPVSEAQLGAAAALRRLQEEERAAHEQWKALLSNPDVGVAQVESASDLWIKISESLRRYELAIEQDRRQSGELLPRTDLEAFAAGFLVNFCGSMRASLEAACPRLAGLDSPGAVWGVLGGIYARALEESAGNAAKRPYAGRSCPEWLGKAIAESIKKHL